MSDQANSMSEVAHALVAFVDAARLNGKGCLFNDVQMQEAGCDGIDKAVMLILNATGSFDLLIPLLKHADRTCASTRRCN